MFDILERDGGKGLGFVEMGVDLVDASRRIFD